jgi:hypothetical protein
MPVSFVPRGAITTPLMVTAIPEIMAGYSESTDVPFVVWQAAAGGFTTVAAGGAVAALDPEGTDTVSVARFFEP